MPLSAHFLAVTPDGCPEEIEAGPFTKEQADDALFAWEMNHGCPARVVCLAEAVEPVAYVVAFEGKTIASKGEPDDDLCSFPEAARVAGLLQIAGIADVEVYGLVPAKE